MKITNVRLRKLEGTMPSPPPVREERFRRPTDIYPQMKEQRVEPVTPVRGKGGKGYHVSRIFVQIETDEGVTGIAGPVAALGPNGPAFYIDTTLKPLLMGKDPIANEFLWDLMFRSNPQGRKGDYMRAVSMVDIALWDLKGKWVGKPVMRLLGGPVQDKIPSYISTLGWSLEPKAAAETTKRLVKEGYSGMKWFFAEGPQDGEPGVRKNIALMQAMRAAAGPDMKIMIDAWKSWDVPYTIRMAEELLEFNPYWIEEPVWPDLYEDYAEITAASPVCIAGGEAHIARFEFELMMDMRCCNLYQPEPIATGGITEAHRIADMASARYLPVSFHCGSLPANLALSFSQSPTVVPIMEYLIMSQLGETQHFFKNEIKPVNGYFYPPTVPGLYDIDESKVESEHDIGWREVNL